MTAPEPREYCRCGKVGIRSEDHAKRVARALAGRRKNGKGRPARDTRPDALRAYPCEVDGRFWHVGHDYDWLLPSTSDGTIRCVTCREVKPTRKFRRLDPEASGARSPRCRSCEHAPGEKRNREAAEARLLVALVEGGAATWQKASYRPAWRLRDKGLVEVQDGGPDTLGRVTARLTQDGVAAADAAEAAFTVSRGTGR